MDDRCLYEDTIKTFKLGYMPVFVNHQLAGRIIIPFYDPSGNLLAISSRKLDANAHIDSSYWHERYEKSFYLYGLHITKEWMRKWKHAVVVEGQIDVLQLYNHGMKNAAALCGTSFSDVQWAAINRYCDEVVFVLDTDVGSNNAGQRGMKKALEKLDTRPSVNSGSHRWYLSDYLHKAKSVMFDEPIDPDDYIKKYGIEPLKQKIKQKVMEMRHARYQFD